MKIPVSFFKYDNLLVKDVSMSENQKPVAAGDQPKEIELKPGIKYSWCQCGRSKSQPFCDTRSHEGTGISPKEFTVSSPRKVWLCMCKQTKTQPYCDGSHNALRSNEVK